MNKSQLRAITVLKRMIEMVESDEYLYIFEEDLDDILDRHRERDAFGTEGQNDPRGDFRNGEWSMWNVEGVD